MTNATNLRAPGEGACRRLQEAIGQIMIKLSKQSTRNRLLPMHVLALIAFALILSASVQPTDSAALNGPVGKHRQSSRDRGCFYMLQHYKNGEPIKTDEPCLNCTCENSMLMCYLRVCPYVKPAGDRCIIERVPGECCPRITCPGVTPPQENFEQETEPETDVPAASTTTPVSASAATSPTDSSATPQPILSGASLFATGNTSSELSKSGGCMVGNNYYPEGAQMPSDSSKSCEVCYCIRGSAACVMQDCALEVSGCAPIYTAGGCCPTRYNCSAENAFTTPRPSLMAELSRKSVSQMGKKKFWDLSPTSRFTTLASEGISSLISSSSSSSSSSTTAAPSRPIVLPDFGRESVTVPGPGCRAPNSTRVYADGERVPSKNKCEHCYCMRGELVCAVQECRPPCDGCVPIIDADDQCCPKRYECAAPIQRVPLDNVALSEQEDSVPSLLTTPQLPRVTDSEPGTSSVPLAVSSPQPPPIDQTTVASSTPPPSEIKSSPATLAEQNFTLNDAASEQPRDSSATASPIEPTRSEGNASPTLDDMATKETAAPKQPEVSVMTTRQTKPPLRPISPKLSSNDDDVASELVPEKDLAKPNKPETNGTGGSVDGFNLNSEREQDQSDVGKSVGRVEAPEGSVPVASQPTDLNEIVPPSLTSTPRVDHLESSTPLPPASDIIERTNMTPDAHDSSSPQNSNNERKSRPLVVPSQIPGEGSCRYNNRLYENGQEVKSRHNCTELCMCINSVVYCDEIDCPRAPENPERCQKITALGECCPKYVCPEEMSGGSTASVLSDTTTSAPEQEVKSVNSTLSTAPELASQAFDVTSTRAPETNSESEMSTVTPNSSTTELPSTPQLPEIPEIPAITTAQSVSSTATVPAESSSTPAVELQPEVAKSENGMPAVAVTDSTETVSSQPASSDTIPNEMATSSETPPEQSTTATSDNSAATSRSQETTQTTQQPEASSTTGESSTIAPAVSNQSDKTIMDKVNEILSSLPSTTEKPTASDLDLAPESEAPPTTTPPAPTTEASTTISGPSDQVNAIGEQTSAQASPTADVNTIASESTQTTKPVETSASPTLSSSPVNETSSSSGPPPDTNATSITTAEASQLAELPSTSTAPDMDLSSTAPSSDGQPRDSGLSSSQASATSSPSANTSESIQTTTLKPLESNEATNSTVGADVGTSTQTAAPLQQGVESAVRVDQPAESQATPAMPVSEVIAAVSDTVDPAKSLTEFSTPAGPASDMSTLATNANPPVSSQHATSESPVTTSSAPLEATSAHPNSTAVPSAETPSTPAASAVQPGASGPSSIEQPRDSGEQSSQAINMSEASTVVPESTTLKPPEFNRVSGADPFPREGAGSQTEALLHPGVESVARVDQPAESQATPAMPVAEVMTTISGTVEQAKSLTELSTPAGSAADMSALTTNANPPVFSTQHETTKSPVTTSSAPLEATSANPDSIAVLSTGTPSTPAANAVEPDASAPSSVDQSRNSGESSDRASATSEATTIVSESTLSTTLEPLESNAASSVNPIAREGADNQTVAQQQPGSEPESRVESNQSVESLSTSTAPVLNSSTTASPGDELATSSTELKNLEPVHSTTVVFDAPSTRAPEADSEPRNSIEPETTTATASSSTIEPLATSGPQDISGSATITTTEGVSSTTTTPIELSSTPATESQPDVVRSETSTPASTGNVSSQPLGLETSFPEMATSPQPSSQSTTQLSDESVATSGPQDTTQTTQQPEASSTTGELSASMPVGSEQSDKTISDKVNEILSSLPSTTEKPTASEFELVSKSEAPPTTTPPAPTTGAGTTLPGPSDQVMGEPTSTQADPTADVNTIASESIQTTKPVETGDAPAASSTPVAETSSSSSPPPNTDATSITTAETSQPAESPTTSESIQPTTPKPLESNEAPSSTPGADAGTSTQTTAPLQQGVESAVRVDQPVEPQTTPAMPVMEVMTTISGMVDPAKSLIELSTPAPPAVEIATIATDKPYESSAISFAPNQSTAAQSYDTPVLSFESLSTPIAPVGEPDTSAPSSDEQPRKSGEPSVVSEANTVVSEPILSTTPNEASTVDPITREGADNQTVAQQQPGSEPESRVESNQSVESLSISTAPVLNSSTTASPGDELATASTGLKNLEPVHSTTVVFDAPSTRAPEADSEPRSSIEPETTTATASSSTIEPLATSGPQDISGSATITTTEGVSSTTTTPIELSSTSATESQPDVVKSEISTPAAGITDTIRTISSQPTSSVTTPSETATSPQTSYESTSQASSISGATSDPQETTLATQLPPSSANTPDASNQSDTTIMDKVNEILSSLPSTTEKPTASDLDLAPKSEAPPTTTPPAPTTEASTTISGPSDQVNAIGEQTSAQASPTADVNTIASELTQTTKPVETSASPTLSSSPVNETSSSSGPPPNTNATSITTAEASQLAELPSTSTAPDIDLSSTAPSSDGQPRDSGLSSSQASATSSPSANTSESIQTTTLKPLESNEATNSTLGADVGTSTQTAAPLQQGVESAVRVDQPAESQATPAMPVSEVIAAVSDAVDPAKSMTEFSTPAGPASDMSTLATSANPPLSSQHATSESPVTTSSAPLEETSAHPDSTAVPSAETPSTPAASAVQPGASGPSSIEQPRDSGEQSSQAINMSEASTVVPESTSSTAVSESTTPKPLESNEVSGVSPVPREGADSQTAAPLQPGAQPVVGVESNQPAASLSTSPAPLLDSSTTASPADEFVTSITALKNLEFKPVNLTTVIPSIRGSEAAVTIPWSDISSSTSPTASSQAESISTTTSQSLVAASNYTEPPSAASNASTEPEFSTSQATIVDTSNFGMHIGNQTRTLTYDTTTQVSVGTPEADYEDVAEEPGCEYEGKAYTSAQQIPRAHPCDFCFCFRGDIICLQQTCPPPVPHCFETVVDGFCCPRYECPVHTVRSTQNSTSNGSLTVTPYETHSRLHSHTHGSEGNATQQARGPSSNIKGCFVDNKLYGVGKVIESASGPCLECRCDRSGMMRCNPKECTPEDPLLQQINREVLSSTLSRSQRRRR